MNETTEEQHHPDCEHLRFECTCEYLNRLEEEYHEEPADLWKREWSL